MNKNNRITHRSIIIISKLKKIEPLKNKLWRILNKILIICDKLKTRIHNFTQDKL